MIWTGGLSGQSDEYIAVLLLGMSVYVRFKGVCVGGVGWRGLSYSLHDELTHIM